jgi:hypothetical protein
MLRDEVGVAKNLNGRSVAAPAPKPRALGQRLTMFRAIKYLPSQSDRLQIMTTAEEAEFDFVRSENCQELLPRRSAPAGLRKLE